MSKNEEMERLVLELLARALLDIRIFSSEENNRACNGLADLFHNVPLHLRKIREDGGDFQEAMDWIVMRASQKNMSQWLQNALNDIAE